MNENDGILLELGCDPDELFDSEPKPRKPRGRPPGKPGREGRQIYTRAAHVHIVEEFIARPDVLIFKYQGSAAEPYTVAFSRQADTLNAICSCPAGANGQLCKHVLSLLQGNAARFADRDEKALAELRALRVGTVAEQALMCYLAAEKASRDSAQQVKFAKHDLMVALQFNPEQNSS